MTDKHTKKRKNAYTKDIFREIRKSLSRFLSIFLIVALGTGFFAGIKSTMPDMKESAADFFEENHLMDIKLMSSVGIQYEDLQAIEDMDGIEGIMASYSCDVYYNYDGQNQVVKAMSYELDSDPCSDSFLNRPILVEGRMPEKSGECVVEVTMKTPASYEIGNTLTLSSPSKDTSITDIFTTDTFEIVGIVASPLYIGFERDATTIGSGSVNSFIIIPEDDFNLSFYTELYIELSETDGMEPFSEEYTEAVDRWCDKLTETFKSVIAARVDKKLETTQNSINSMEKKLSQLESMQKLDIVGLYDFCAALQEEITELEGKDGTLYSIELSQKQALLKQAQALVLSREAGETAADDELSETIEKARLEIESAKEQMSLVSEQSVYGFTRFSSSDYASYAGDSEKIDAIAKVFPVFFIFIAALVCLTTMTRMVDEKRIEIGTYKALGYSSLKIISKYLIYSTIPTALGSLVGVSIGFKVFPYIIYNSYKILYNIPSIDTPFRVGYAVGCTVCALLCVWITVIAACKLSLSSQPSELMRPKAVPPGKRVLLEKVTFVWKRLGFLSKVTIRNLLRYKKRFAMTLVGIAGCTALIMTAFGIKNSISKVADLQFEGVFGYDALAVINPEEVYDDADAEKVLSEFEDVSQYILMSSGEVEVTSSGNTQPASLMVPKNPNELDPFIRLRDCKTGGKLDISDGEAVITEKITQLLGVSVGDTITVQCKDKPDVTLKIAAISENYAMHFVFITENTYRSIYGESPVYNQSYLILKENTDKTELSSSLIEKDEFLGIAFLEDKADSFFSSIDSLNSIVWLLIVCAALLAFIVLYNLANINITERVREIATLKVLGFYDGETSAYIYRENILTTVLGIVLGWGAGLVLHRFVVLTAEVDLVMFSREMVWYAYVMSALLTVVFAVIVNLVLHIKLKKIDMVESLKSIE